MKSLTQIVKEILYENIGPVYRGTSHNVGSLSFEKGIEFGIHFGDESSARHRGSFHGDNFSLKKYTLNVNNLLELDDVMRWNLENILNNMKVKGIVSPQDAVAVKTKIKSQAIALSKQKGSRMTTEENLLLRDYLQKLGYDGIKYKNKGEANGDAYIIFDEHQATEIK